MAQAKDAINSFRIFVGLFWRVLNPGRPFHRGWIIDAQCELAEAVAVGQITHLICLVPPGTTKSTIWTQCYPAWRWAKDPSSRFLVGSNSDDNASRDSMATRRIVESELYQQAYCHDDKGNRLWGLSDEQNAKGWFNTTETGHRQSVTVNGVITGKKGDELLLDDPNDARKVHSTAERNRVRSWFGEGFYSRSNDPKTARYVVDGQHTHTDDLQSHLIKQGGWTVFRAPEQYDPRERCVVPEINFADPRTKEGEWLRPERFGPREKEQAKRIMGARAYAAQHDLKPLSATGRMFDRNKITAITALPVGTALVRYWDTAATVGESACYTSGVLMGRTPEGRYIVVHVKRGQWTPAERNLVMRNTGFSDMAILGKSSYRMYFEKGTADAGVERDADLIAYLAGIPVESDPARGDKQVRAEPLSSQWAAGNVCYVLDQTGGIYEAAGERTGWNLDYLDEMEAFPDQSLKDSVDASSGAFNKLVQYASDVDPGTADEGDTYLGSLPKGVFSNRVV
jgi:predicted phage terminase large subunit-like protein